MSLVLYLSILLVVVVVVVVVVRMITNTKLDRNGKLVIGFLHPACNSGGGGEKVLWSMI